MSPRWNENRLTAKLGIDYPVIQGPLGGLSSQKLTAAVSNFGGLGSLGALNLSPEAIKDVIAEIRSLTAKPFAMNLWVSQEDDGARRSDESAFNRSLPPIAHHLTELGAPLPTYKPYSPATRFEDQARALIDAKVPVFSFIFGIPPREILQECRSETHRHDWHGDHTRRGCGTSRGRRGCDRRFRLRSRGTSRFIPPRRGGFTYRHLFARPSDCRHSQCAGDRCRGHRGCARLNCRSGSWRRGRANGNGIPGVRGVRRQPPSSPGFTREKSRAHRADKGLHRKTRAGNPQPPAGGVEPAGNRRFCHIPCNEALVRNLAIPAEAAGRSDLLPLWAGQSANLSTCTDVLAFLTSLVEEASEIAGPIIQWSAARRAKQILK